MLNEETKAHCLIEALREERWLRGKRAQDPRPQGLDTPIEEVEREEPEGTPPMETDLPWPPDFLVADSLLDQLDKSGRAGQADPADAVDVADSFERIVAELDDPIEEVEREEPEGTPPMETDLPWPPDRETLHRWLDQISDTGERRRELRACAKAEVTVSTEGRQQRELPADVNPHDLSATGWGVITPRGMSETYLARLDPLLERRREQAGARYREDLIFDPKESPADFLWHTLDLSPGVIDPDKLPYYLLIVGGPEWIPFEVQYLLSINHAVGRIAFDDETDAGLEDYRRWAESVVEAETRGVDRPRRASILSVDSGDRATRTLRTHLVEPIAERVGHLVSQWPESHAWKVDILDGQNATKEGFQRALGGDETPALALVAAHGLSLDRENSHQRAFQGAFACQQDRHTPIESRYFHAGDIRRADSEEDAADQGQASNGSLHGTIAFLFSCYGAGTPLEDDYPQHTPEGYKVDQLPPAKRLAETPFIAALPQEMLRQGALAVVGHVDRGWTLSFAWTLALRYTDAVRSLEDSLKQLLRGHRLGHAMRSFHRRYTAIAAHLSDVVDRDRRGRERETRELGAHWTAHHDARNFILLGDPAVYLLGKPAADHAGLGDPWRWPRPRTERRTDDSASIVLSPDIQRFVEQEAADQEISPSAWLERLLRARIVSGVQ